MGYSVYEDISAPPCSALGRTTGAGVSSLLEQPLLDITYLDEDVPCQGYDETCKKPAHWRIDFTCCVNQRNSCNDCKAEQVALAIAYRGRLHCCFCNARPALFTWRPL